MKHEKKIFNDTKISFRIKSNYELIKYYFIFKIIQHPWITKFFIKIINFLIKYNIFFISFFIKNTIFKCFCGGEKKKKCISIVRKIYKYGIKSVLDYSIEGLSKENDFNKIFKEILKNIDFAEKNKSIPFVVFKPTGIGSIFFYEKIGKKKKLNFKDKIIFNKIKNRFNGICRKAFYNNVFVLIDAEESWMQDTADFIVEKMMEKYNKKKCIIFNTLQMYRWDKMKFLKKSYKEAIKKKYYLGYKIVRGAYMEKEIYYSKLKNFKKTIHKNKIDTDYDYNKAIKYIINNNNYISLFAGTHNEKSCFLLKKLIKKNNFKKKNIKIWFGQLYGMSDNITFYLGKKKFNSTKYLPYGPLKKTIPYLIRRAQENTSISGQTSRELFFLKKEIKRRIKNYKFYDSK